jgi:hypothetical protein
MAGPSGGRETWSSLRVVDRGSGGLEKLSRLHWKSIRGLESGLKGTRSDHKLDRAKAETTRTLDEALDKVETKLVLPK